MSSVRKQRPDIVCKLTGTKGPGVDAHIIPESFYQFPKHNRKPSRVIQLGKQPSSWPTTKGEYDPNIVTIEGESHFSTWDGYACRFLIQKGQDAVLLHDGSSMRAIQISDFDYDKLKMFFISLLWRAGVTSREMFRHVRLGDHESRLRGRILRNDPGDAEDYSVILAVYQDTPDHGFPMIEPRAERLKKIRFYRFYLSHFVALVKCDQRPTPDPLDSIMLSPTPPATILNLGRFQALSVYSRLRDAVRKLKTNR